MTFRSHDSISYAIELECVPAFNLASIERRAAKPPAQRNRTRVLIASIALFAIPCLAIAAVTTPAANVWHDFVAQLQHHHVRMTLSDVAAQPVTSLTAENAIECATFHLVLPTGLPPNTKLVDIEEQGTDGALFTAAYRLADGRRAMFIFQKKQRKRAYIPWIGQGSYGRDGAVRTSLRPARIWFVGDEVVTAASDRLTPEQLEAIKRAMHGIDPMGDRGLVVVR